MSNIYICLEIQQGHLRNPGSGAENWAEPMWRNSQLKPQGRVGSGVVEEGEAMHEVKGFLQKHKNHELVTRTLPWGVDWCLQQFRGFSGLPPGRA